MHHWALDLFQNALVIAKAGDTAKSSINFLFMYLLNTSLASSTLPFYQSSNAFAILLFQI